MSLPAPRAWLLAVRPWSFPASGVPALFAATHAWRVEPDRFAWGPAVLAVAGAVLFQAAGNLISDFFDLRRGVDRPDTHGGSRVLVNGDLTPRQVLRAGLALTALGSLLGLALAATSTPWLLLAGALGVISALAYSVLKYHAWGDAAVFATFGVLIPVGVTMVGVGRPLWSVLLTSTPLGLLIVGILHANNARDIVHDARAGIRTFATVIGARASRWYYEVLTVGAYLLLVVGIPAGRVHPALAVALLSLPLAVRNLRAMRHSREGVGSIVALDGGTAQLVLAFGLLLVAANVVAGVLA